MRPLKNPSWFSQFSKAMARLAGRPSAFAAASAIVVLWILSGPLFGFSDTWQLVINTGTTIITFLMVFIIQNTQNRDTEAMHVKLDELIRATKGAHNALLNLEGMEEGDLEKIRADYQELAKLSRLELKGGRKDTGTPDVKEKD